MTGRQVVNRYALALYDTAYNKRVLDSVKKDVEVIEQLCSERQIRMFLLKPAKSVKAVNELLEIAFFPFVRTDITVNFLKTTVRNRREELLPFLGEAFRKIDYARKGIVLVHAEFSDKPDTAVLNYLEEKMRKKLNKKILLETEINRRLIKGFRITWNYIQIDKSIAGKVRMLKERLLSGDNI